MPKRRPMEALKLLGQRIRSRRQHLGLAREAVARGADISVTMLGQYEGGNGAHPPAFTLHRIAAVLKTSTSALLGEVMTENAKQVEEILQVYSHPAVAAVVQSMRGMTKEDRGSLRIIATALAARHRAAPAQSSSVGR